MSSQSPRAGSQRVLVPVDLQTLWLLDVAADIAELLQLELQAMFVEDDDLLRLARLPGFQEMGLATSVLRDLDVAAMQRSLRARAERLRQSLANVAESRRLSWSFRVTRGQIARTSLETATDTDVIVVSRASAARIRPDWPLVVLYDGTAPARRALQMASEVAQTSHVHVVVIPVDGDAAHLDRVTEHAHTDVADLGVDARVQHRAISTKEELGNLMRDLHAHSIWMGCPCALLDPCTVDQLVLEMPCPLVIIR